MQRTNTSTKREKSKKVNKGSISLHTNCFKQPKRIQAKVRQYSYFSYAQLSKRKNCP